MVRPTRFERATPSLGNLCSILLSYGRMKAQYTMNKRIKHYTARRLPLSTYIHTCFDKGIACIMIMV